MLDSTASRYRGLVVSKVLSGDAKKKMDLIRFNAVRVSALFHAVGAVDNS